MVIDNHVDNCVKEILAFVYYGSIANNRPKKKRKLILVTITFLFLSGIFFRFAQGTRSSAGDFKEYCESRSTKVN